MPPLKRKLSRKRYYVEKPVVVIDLDEYESLLTQLVRMSLMHTYDVKVQAGLKARNTILLRNGWETLGRAKEHYKIKP